MSRYDDRTNSHKAREFRAKMSSECRKQALPLPFEGFKCFLDKYPHAWTAYGYLFAQSCKDEARHKLYMHLFNKPYKWQFFKVLIKLIDASVIKTYHTYPASKYGPELNYLNLKLLLKLPDCSHRKVYLHAALKIMRDHGNVCPRVSFFDTIAMVELLNETADDLGFNVHPSMDEDDYFQPFLDFSEK